MKKCGTASVVFLFAISCQPEDAIKGGDPIVTELRSVDRTPQTDRFARPPADDGPFGTAVNLTREERAQRSAWSEQLHKLNALASDEEKLTEFSRLMLEIPNEHHELLAAKIIDDLRGGAEVNYLQEYMESAPMLEPMLQLPTYGKVLMEGKLSMLQKVAIEQELKLLMNIAPDDEPRLDEWPDRIDAFLSEFPGLFEE